MFDYIKVWDEITATKPRMTSGKIGNFTAICFDINYQQYTIIIIIIFILYSATSTIVRGASQHIAHAGIYARTYIRTHARTDVRTHKYTLGTTVDKHKETNVQSSQQS